MNLQEYRQRLNNMHTFTGIPTYWQDLQQMTEDRDRWQALAMHLLASNPSVVIPEEIASLFEDYNK